MKILFVFPYPHGTAASQRFRFEQYLGFLKEKGIDYSLAPFLDVATWRILYKPGHTIEKLLGILKGFFRRVFLLFQVSKYDYVFIHREATPLGPPVFEWMVAKVFRKKIIFDFDDAIWLPNTSKNNKIASRLKWHSKTANICRWAYKISAGNKYLAEYAQQFNTMVFINPTTIDTKGLHNQLKDQHSEPVVIGWTGTHSTIQYLHFLIPVLQKLERHYNFTFLVISDKEPDFHFNSLQYIPWNKASEREDLLQMHIGVMPLTNDQWAIGKCGFKALQYMALGIPAIASPIGVNTEIIIHGENGFLCQTEKEWEEAFIILLKDAQLRQSLGKAARQRIEDYYSVQANCGTFLAHFDAWL